MRSDGAPAGPLPEHGGGRATRPRQRGLCGSVFLPRGTEQDLVDVHAFRLAHCGRTAARAKASAGMAFPAWCARIASRTFAAVALSVSPLSSRAPRWPRRARPPWCGCSRASLPDAASRRSPAPRAWWPSTPRRPRALRGRQPKCVGDLAVALAISAGQRRRPWRHGRHPLPVTFARCAWQARMGRRNRANAARCGCPGRRGLRLSAWRRY